MLFYDKIKLIFFFLHEHLDFTYLNYFYSKTFFWWINIFLERGKINRIHFYLH